jgi:hypothetical protein
MIIAFWKESQALGEKASYPMPRTLFPESFFVKANRIQARSASS